MKPSARLITCSPQASIRTIAGAGFGFLFGFAHTAYPDQLVVTCQQLQLAAYRLRAPLARLARFQRTPTQLAGVMPAARALLTANIHLGLELALTRRCGAGSTPPRTPRS